MPLPSRPLAITSSTVSATSDAIRSVDLTPRREDTATDTVWS